MRSQSTLIWFGRNESNQSQFSAKVYIASLRGDSVIRQWGAADIRKRQVEMRWMRSLTMRYASPREAAETMRAIVQAKLDKGYERAPRAISVMLPPRLRRV